MNGSQRRFLRLALACGCLAVVCDRGAGQAIVGGFRIIAGGHGALPGVGPALAGAGNGADVVFEGDAIGDPWWDEVEEKGPAAPNQAAAGNEAGKEMDLVIEQLRQPGLAVLRRELSVVRQTCPSLERQQRALVLAAGRGAIKSFMADFDRDNQLRRRNIKSDDVTAAVEAAVRASVAANATPDESAAYEAEQRLRRERAKQAAVAVLVAAVDRHAYLDESERQEIGKSFAASYRERWRPALVAVQQGRGVETATRLPGVERCIEQALGKNRTAAWRKQRDEAEKLAAAGGLPLKRQIVPMQMVPNGPVQVQVEAFGEGNQQQVIINGKRVFVGAAGGGLQMRVLPGGGVEIGEVPRDAKAQAEEDNP